MNKENERNRHAPAIDKLTAVLRSALEKERRGRKGFVPATNEFSESLPRMAKTAFREFLASKEAETLAGRDTLNKIFAIAEKIGTVTSGLNQAVIEASGGLQPAKSLYSDIREIQKRLIAISRNLIDSHLAHVLNHVNLLIDDVLFAVGDAVKAEELKESA